MPDGAVLRVVEPTAIAVLGFIAVLPSFVGFQLPLATRDLIALVRLINEHSATMKVRTDQRLVIVSEWPTPEARLKGVQAVLTAICKLAKAA
ncbi:MAG TPA: hypothetical protein VMU01_06735 [Rhizomicrobium sp.]|nr:hypothetical protein [Rhizomicrobium sp.]